MAKADFTLHICSPPYFLDLPLISIKFGSDPSLHMAEGQLDLSA